ncbi:hypothetical protein TNCV_462031 [Trichonephila clavipes]|uniref:Uncharacterized protein n=1 Tax=Trichonephila clavipes TaxID=2585209 RepID=A0A8X6UWV9_TRICX|nr:hypothetical protein TNCV_462031 [Trichonephila clavipes]
MRRVSRQPELPEPRQILEPSVQIPEPHVPEPPAKIPPEPIPEPIPKLDTLEPILTDAASLDQLMSFVFGEASPTQQLQLLQSEPSIFDNDLISFLDEFERELGPMDLTMPRLNPCVKRSIGLKPSNPWINPVAVNNCL